MHPEAMSNFHIGEHPWFSHNRDSYLNSGKLTVYWRDISQFQLEIAIAFPAIS